jgi:hypothetical protein
MQTQPREAYQPSERKTWLAQAAARKQRAATKKTTAKKKSPAKSHKK